MTVTAVVALNDFKNLSPKRGSHIFNQMMMAQSTSPDPDAAEQARRCNALVQSLAEEAAKSKVATRSLIKAIASGIPQDIAVAEAALREISKKIIVILDELDSCRPPNNMNRNEWIGFLNKLTIAYKKFEKDPRSGISFFEKVGAFFERNKNLIGASAGAVAGFVIIKKLAGVVLLPVAPPVGGALILTP
jgi:hypothetical protein